MSARSHAPEQALGLGDRLGSRDAAHAHRRLDDVLQHRHVRPEVEPLEHEADLDALPGDVPLAVGTQLAVLALAVPDQVAVHLDAPRSIVSRWLMQRRNVVLPEPDWPIRHTDLAAMDVERDALQHLDPAEALVHVHGVHDQLARGRSSDLPRERQEAQPHDSRSSRSLAPSLRSIHPWMNPQIVVSIR